jgi:CHAD domain-containing protein
MHSGFFPSAGHAAISCQSEWQQKVDAWRDLLAQCAKKPSPKRVRALRTFTLRLEVALEYRLLEQAPDRSAASAFRRWSKEGKKLRRALKPVRDADVFLARLESLRDSLESAPGGELRFSPRYLRQIERLEGRLRQRREVGIEKLLTFIDAHGKRLSRSSERIEAALAARIPSVARSTAPAALRIFAELASELPDLNSANLHDYRKRLKPALYLAEISIAADPEAGRLAAAFRKIHLAAGEWHDWLTLALKAGRVLPGRAKQDDLIPVLEKLADTALERALDLSRRSAVQLLKDVEAVRPFPQRKPVASEPGWHSGVQLRTRA